MDGHDTEVDLLALKCVFWMVEEDSDSTTFPVEKRALLRRVRKEGFLSRLTLRVTTNPSGMLSEGEANEKCERSSERMVDHPVSDVAVTVEMARNVNVPAPTVKDERCRSDKYDT